MSMMLRAGLLAIAAVLAAASVACDDGELEPFPDYTAVFESLPQFPGASLARTGVVPPALRTETPERYVQDRLYITVQVDDPSVIISYFNEELPAQGWETESVIEPTMEELATYCQTNFISCGSYVRDDVRVIVSSIVPLSFAPQEIPASSYHVHVEPAEG